MTALNQHALRPSHFIAGAQESILLLRLKWRTIRSLRVKILIWAGVFFFAGLVYASSNTGYMVRLLAEGWGGQDSLSQQVALDYLATFTQGQLGTIGSTALGAAIFSSIIAPFTGAVSTSLMPQMNLASVRVSNKHRFTDSIFTQFISSVSLLQLLALTGISSLLTIQGGRPWGIIFTLLLCPVFVLMSVTSLWLAEYLHRRFGGRIRLIIIGSALAVAGIAIYFDPAHGRTVFGVGTFYASVVQNIDLGYTWGQKAFVLGVAALLAISLLFISGTISSYALMLPERNSNATASKKRVARKSSKYPEIEMFLILISQVWRNAETRRPVLAAAGMGALLAFATSASFAISTTFAVMVPVVIALAWGVNVFGIIGSGTTWLASQPRIFLMIPWIIASVQITLTLSVFSIVWIPTFIAGRATLDDVIAISLSGIATAFLVTRSSLSKTINSPYATAAGVRGQTIAPPAATLSYTLRLVLWSGQYGVIILVVNNHVVELGMCLVAVLWSCFRLARLRDKWNSPALRMKVINAVSR